MREFFNPTGSPIWLTQVLRSIKAALGDIWATPLRLKDYPTADLPPAADFKGGLVFDSTLLTFCQSDGASWVQFAPVVGGTITASTVAATGRVTLSGSNSFGSALTSTGQIYRSATLGIVVAGAGSTSDFTLANKAGSIVMSVATGGVDIVFAGNVSGRDLHASRGDGTGVLYLNAAADRYIYFDGAYYQFPDSPILSSGGVRVTVGGIQSDSYYIGTAIFAQHATSYHILYLPGGSPAIYLGGSGDQANYYDNTTHYWRSNGGSDIFGYLDRGTLFLANSLAVPAANPVGGGFLYVQGGALKYRGSSGTVTTIAPA